MTREELVNLCKEGNEQAFSLLYKTYANKMKHICSRYISDKQTVSDLLHDGFIIIFTSIHTLRSPEKLESWMGKIMKNMSLKYLEQYHSTVIISTDEIEESEEPQILSYSNDFPSYAEILKMIETLPEGYCKVFKLAVLEGLSHKEIGLLLNIAPHSSSSQLSRAKKLLRKLMSQYHIAIVLFILSSIILLQLLFYKSKETVNSLSKTATQSREGEKSKDLLFKNTVNNSPTHIPTRQYVENESSKIEISEKEAITQDNITKRRDSTNIYNHSTAKKQKKVKNTELYHTVISQHAMNDEKNWALALSISGVNKQTNIQKTIIPGDISSGKPQEVTTKSYYHIPITLSFSLHKKINEYWGIETGLQYTYLRSEFTTITDSHLKETQKINYIGIPLKGTFSVWNRKKFSIYISAGATLDIPVKATSEKVISDKNGNLISDKKSNIYPPLQWSTNFGIGIQYQITPTIGIYTEPNLNYYFNNSYNIKTIRTEKPCNVTLPIGIRLYW